MGTLTEIAKRFITSPRNQPQMSATMAMPLLRKQGKTNALQLRHWAQHATWPRVAIDIRRGQVTAAEWDIVPFDPEQKYPVRMKERIKRLFDAPNPRDQHFAAFIDPMVEDIHVLDAGCIEKERDLMGRIVALWPVDGAAIKVNRFWDGSNPDEPRYYWWPDGYEEVATLTNEDLLYIMLRPATHRSVGLASLEILKAVIDADLRGFDYNARQVATAGGEGIFDLGENARPEQVERFKSYFFAEVAGRAATAFWGGTKNAKWIPFRASNRDMQFLEWQVYLAKNTAAVFGLHPQDLGLTNEVNKAVGEVLDQQTEDRGARTQLARIQEYFTREIVWDASFGGRDNNLAFRFTKLNMRETQAEAQVEKIQLAGMPSRAVNEIRKKHGLEPWGEEFDLPMVITPTGAVSLIEVPTASEALASRGRGESGAPPAEPPPGGKSLEEIALLARNVEEFQGMVRDQYADQPYQIQEAVRAASAKDVSPPPPPAPVLAPGAIQIHLTLPENKPGVTETTFTFDETGRVVGKVQRPADEENT